MDNEGDSSENDGKQPEKKGMEGTDGWGGNVDNRTVIHRGVDSVDKAAGSAEINTGDPLAFPVFHRDKWIIVWKSTVEICQKTGIQGDHNLEARGT